VSQHAESQAVESATSAVVEPPQDAKETATIAANINTNFFIFFTTFKIKKYLLLKPGAKLRTFCVIHKKKFVFLLFCVFNGDITPFFSIEMMI
jgi:hypothetical protein